jgi:hypothetical protein
MMKKAGGPEGRLLDECDPSDTQRGKLEGNWVFKSGLQWDVVIDHKPMPIAGLNSPKFFFPPNFHFGTKGGDEPVDDKGFIAGVGNLYVDRANQPCQ